jgi:hypothetical protein
VDTADTSDDNTPPGVGATSETVDTPGVGEDNTAGVENEADDTAGVENEHDNQTEQETALQDSDYEPEMDESDSNVDENEADNMNADAAREQTTADITVEDVDSSDEYDDNDHDNNPPSRTAILLFLDYV